VDTDVHAIAARSLAEGAELYSSLSDKPQGSFALIRIKDRRLPIPYVFRKTGSYEKILNF
jgi:hypothetical protein